MKALNRCYTCIAPGCLSEKNGNYRYEVMYSYEHPHPPYLKAQCSHIVSFPYAQLPEQYKKWFPTPQSYVDWFRQHPKKAHLRSVPQEALLAEDFPTTVLKFVHDNVCEAGDEQLRRAWNSLPVELRVDEATYREIDEAFVVVCALNSEHLLNSTRMLADKQNNAFPLTVLRDGCELKLEPWKGVGVHRVCDLRCHVELLPLSVQATAVIQAYRSDRHFAVALHIYQDNLQVSSAATTSWRPHERQFFEAIRAQLKALTRSGFEEWRPAQIGYVPYSKPAKFAGRRKPILKGPDGQAKKSMSYWRQLPFVRGLSAELLSHLCTAGAENDWAPNIMKQLRGLFCGAHPAIAFKWQEYESHWTSLDRKSCDHLKEHGDAAKKHVHNFCSLLYFLHRRTNLLCDQDGQPIDPWEKSNLFLPGFPLALLFARIWTNFAVVRAWKAYEMEKHLKRHNRQSPSPQWHIQRDSMIRTGFEITMILVKTSPNSVQCFPDLGRVLTLDAAVWLKHPVYRELTKFNSRRDPTARAARDAATASAVQRGIEQDIGFPNKWNEHYYLGLIASIRSTLDRAKEKLRLGEYLEDARRKLGSFPIAQLPAGFFKAHDETRFLLATQTIAEVLRRAHDRLSLTHDQMSLKQRLDWLRTASLYELQCHLVELVDALGPECYDELERIQPLFAVVYQAMFPTGRWTETAALALGAVGEGSRARPADFRAIATGPSGTGQKAPRMLLVQRRDFSSFVSPDPPRSFIFVCASSFTLHL